MADFDGDGAQDLVAVSSGNGTASVLLGAGNGTFAKAIDYAAGDRPLHLTVADLNGDARPDLVVSTDTGLNVLLNDGHGPFPRRRLSQRRSPAPTAIAIGDLDGDEPLIRHGDLRRAHR